MASLNEKLQQIESSLDPKLFESLSELVSNINEKDQVITTLQKEVCYLNKKVNELERYSSKDCIIIQNLPLLSPKQSLVEDVVRLLNEQLQIKVMSSDIVACHFLAPYKGTKDPPPVIVKFVYFWQKDRAWSRKYWLKNYTNPVNGFPVYFRERLTKSDRDLMDYMHGLGLKTATNNCVPQILIKTQNGIRKHNVVDAADADEILESGKAVLMKESKKIPMNTHSYSNDTSKTPNAKRNRPDSAKPTFDAEITNQLKMLRNESDPGKLKQYIDMLVGDSPPAKSCNKSHEDETSSSGTPMTD